MNTRFNDSTAVNLDETGAETERPEEVSNVIVVGDEPLPEARGLDPQGHIEETPPRKRRGFATWGPERIRAAASKGGLAAHALGVAHEFTREEAIVAGRKGGLAVRAKRNGGAR